MKLDQFLKWKQMVSSGGEAKNLIMAGLVSVNGTVETKRGRKLRDGDVVCFRQEEFIFYEGSPRAT